MLSHLYGKHNHAGSSSNVVNGLVDPQLGLYPPITDMLLQVFWVGEVESVLHLPQNLID